MSLSKENKAKMDIIIGNDNRPVSTDDRLKEMASIRIYEDEEIHKKVEKLERMIKTVWRKEDIIIKQLTVIGGLIERGKK